MERRARWRGELGGGGTLEKPGPDWTELKAILLSDNWKSKWKLWEIRKPRLKSHKTSY